MPFNLVISIYPLTEKFPEPDKRVLLFCKDGDVEVGHYEPCEIMPLSDGRPEPYPHRGQFENDEGEIYCEITHWAEQPIIFGR